MKEITIVKLFVRRNWDKAIYIDNDLYRYISDEYESDSFEEHTPSMEIIKLLAQTSNITIKTIRLTQEQSIAKGIARHLSEYSEFLNIT